MQLTLAMALAGAATAAPLGQKAKSGNMNGKYAVSSGGNVGVNWK
jgi:hypothetical protein